MKESERKIIEGTLCVLYSKERYLLRLETEGINKGCWIFPGGSYERAESGVRELGVECVIRETEEETGMTPIRPKLKARIFFDNFKRIFPGKINIADFDYDALYYISTEYIGEFKKISPDGREQKWFRYDETLILNMHQGDREILKALERIPRERVFEGNIVHKGTDLEFAVFHDV
jgi:8-oxo-dGTP diphosphatase